MVPKLQWLNRLHRKLILIVRAEGMATTFGKAALPNFTHAWAESPQNWRALAIWCLMCKALLANIRKFAPHNKSNQRKGMHNYFYN